ncbi:hypothetical protein U1Q18_047255 [Sarracenia purpurea var. burkii]
MEVPIEERPICVNGAPAGVSQGQLLAKDSNEVSEDVLPREDNSEYQLASRDTYDMIYDYNSQHDEADDSSNEGNYDNMASLGAILGIPHEIKNFGIPIFRCRWIAIKK